jgi:predicted transcriptional regulator
MAFTAKDFPNRVFENDEEYKACIAIREKIRAYMRSKKKDILIEVDSIIKRNNPVLLALIESIRSKT